MDNHDFNPMLGFTLAQMDIITDSIATDDIRPIPSQFNMGPGTTAVVASSMSADNESLTVATILDPEEYKDTYPDFGDRLLNSFVLCKYYESGPFKEQGGSIGWFSRVKLIEVPQEHYDEVYGFIETDDFPKEPPSWLGEAYDKFQVELSSVSPDIVPSPIGCANCGKFKVSMHLEHTVSLVTEAGVLTRNGEEKIVPIGDHSRSCMSIAKLVCTNCGWYANVKIPQIYANHNNAIQSLLGHGH